MLLKCNGTAYVYTSFKIRLQKIKSKCKDVSWHMYMEYQESSLGHFILQISSLLKSLEKTDANKLKQLRSKGQTYVSLLLLFSAL